MKKFFNCALLFLVCLSCSAFAQTKSAKERETPLIVGYLADFRLKDYSIKELEKRGAGQRLTHIIYAFVNIVDGLPALANEQVAYKQAYSASESVDGRADDASQDQALRGAFNQLRKLKLRYPQLKVLVSIGGASQANDKGFSLLSRNLESRQRFIAACIDLFIRGNLPRGISAKGLFDGIDIDWEYPTDCSAGMKGGEGCIPEDKQNFTRLLAEFRRQLDYEGKLDRKHYQLTMAGSAWVDDYEKYEWQKIHPLLDFINVMTYGLAPPGKTRPHSPLYKSSSETGKWSPTFNTDYAVTRYLKEDVPATKIVIGVPFYGMGWEGVPDINNGLYQKPAGDARSEPYHKLKDLKGFHLYRDSETQALWTYNPQTKVFWSFDDPVSLAVKMDYVRQRGLGGVMFWEISGDDQKGSLLKAIYRGLHK